MMTQHTKETVTSVVKDYVAVGVGAVALLGVFAAVVVTYNDSGRTAEVVKTHDVRLAGHDSMLAQHSWKIELAANERVDLKEAIQTLTDAAVKLNTSAERTQDVLERVERKLDDVDKAQRQLERERLRSPN